ncbi:hypothetical protein A1Q2_06939 [Trichosporon asahii var. asahii CBS 8904]|uniref:Uncharacterized protein n=2 Tax=Trichosporon asahii var. asahii TaxID=189963 RepID=K1VPU7_TRIAC|nr:hypothetical protein A1Q1_06275 [Trichosporon asahii var. asahii CBS 2479]EJT52169.1 hypothetical protein A1Q1_06275 [Trichosporon asahii var. asahii CBS 2479]EKC98707.1 hypothetical protein A1Q2_06939 [Trichosporon asahii var. asahii CBS 8904]
MKRKLSVASRISSSKALVSKVHRGLGLRDLTTVFNSAPLDIHLACKRGELASGDRADPSPHRLIRCEVSDGMLPKPRNRADSQSTLNRTLVRSLTVSFELILSPPSPPYGPRCGTSSPQFQVAQVPPSSKSRVIGELSKFSSSVDPQLLDSGF